MYIAESTIGELYGSFDTLTIKRLSAHIRANGNETSLRLHNLLAKWKEENSLETKDMNELQSSFYKEKSIVKSSFTTHVNVLVNLIKEYIILSKTKAKNIYTETLWGEYLIENRLKRNLIIKQSMNTLDVFRDEYPFQKKYYQKRERLFLNQLDTSYKNQKNTYTSLMEEINTFKIFEISKKLESYIALTSLFYNKKEYSIDLNEVYKVIELGNNCNDIPIKINSLVLKLTVEESFGNYNLLKNEFMSVYRLFSIESSLQIIGIILKFGLDKLGKGEHSYSIENYNFYLFLEENEILYRSDFFNQNHMNRYITLCIKHDSSLRARAVLEEHVSKLPKAQIESCYNLNLAKIEFAEKNYKASTRLLYQINTNLVLFYLPLTKILLLKNLVETEDYDRLAAEKKNFYKYYYASKTLPDDIKQQYELYHKYIEHMLSVKYEYLSDYKRKKISIALQDDSPHFVQKEWMKSRWQWLQDKYGE